MEKAHDTLQGKVAIVTGAQTEELPGGPLQLSQADRDSHISITQDVD